MFEKFTERARKVMSLSRQSAQEENSELIGTEHILIGLINEGGGVACKVLKNLNVDPNKVMEEVKKLMTPSSPPVAHTLGQIPFSPRSKRVIELANDAASQLGNDVIGTEHLLLALLKENEGLAAQALINLGFKLDVVRDNILEVLGMDVSEAPVRVSEGEKKIKCSSCRKEFTDKDAQMNDLGREKVCEDCYMSLTSFERLLLKMLGQMVKQQGRKY
jgi:ATP-dependent Clp protease ATP-binding subunit ClpC